MASRSDVNQIVNSNRDIRALVDRDLDAFWGTLDWSVRPEVARDEVLAFVPGLVAKYGDVAATVAADWYSQLRDQAGAAGAFDPHLASTTPADAVVARARFGLGSAFEGNAAQSLAFLQLALGGYAIQAGRDTIVASAHADRRWRPGVARVPQGAHTCAFCLTMASRGPVYYSLETAGRNNQYHGDCDCQPTLIGRGDDLPDGYDPHDLYQQYQAARQATQSKSLTNVLATMRDHDGLS